MLLGSWASESRLDLDISSLCFEWWLTTVNTAMQLEIAQNSLETLENICYYSMTFKFSCQNITLITTYTS